MRYAALVLVCLLGASAYAVDTPTVTPPTVSERMGTARQAIERGGWSRAQYDLQSVVRDVPDNADAHNLLAYTYRKQEKPDLAKAFEHYKVALKLDPQHKGAHEYIGEAYLMAKQPAQAEKHLQDLARICGNTHCEEYVDLAKALAAYKKANP
ncbi:tetratricopeptide repeat protein [Rhodoferax aquaticus]|uniref:Tetratricopeptide repeat protein n=1 Tax=Rhodoferax aquaticus TaxID=2527691 RepID=A0A515ERM1_9BURK|nr:tetratricopeptide repeat protein [Rhodoferax aquaticus]QDL55288.1 tetratricopeptide repeat protein [Rhodoferax aquaticus]